MVYRVATSSCDVGTSQNMLIYVKRLANKTTHCKCSSKRVKQPSESMWLAKQMVTMEGEKPRLIWRKRLIEWKSRGLKYRWVHFYTSLNHRELCLESVSCLHKLETKNYAWIQFHFYTSLKRKIMLEFGFIFRQARNEKLCLKLVYMPPTWWKESLL